MTTGLTVRVSSVSDFAALGERWRSLETHADPSFFQTWAWTGCLAAERFPDPVLVEATENGQTVALALFNRIGRRLHLGASGIPALDVPYIEQNAVLTQSGRDTERAAACLRAVASRYTLILPGATQTTLDATRHVASQTQITEQRSAPFASLLENDWFDRRSANTRQQLRRSDRHYGTITLHTAASVAEAQSMLDEMAPLHQATWTARGQPGCFAEPFFARFHHALIAAAHPRGEIAMTRITAGDTLIGILYNFVFRGRILAYQSGLAYPKPPSPAKPGLTCHAAAIQAASAAGLHTYDFLAGDDRYKRSLADGAAPQYWIEAGPWWTPSLLLHRLRAALR